MRGREITVEEEIEALEGLIRSHGWMLLAARIEEDHAASLQMVVDDLNPRTAGRIRALEWVLGLPAHLKQQKVIEKGEKENGQEGDSGSSA